MQFWIYTKCSKFWNCSEWILILNEPFLKVQILSTIQPAGLSEPRLRPFGYNAQNLDFWEWSIWDKNPLQFYQCLQSKGTKYLLKLFCSFHTGWRSFPIGFLVFDLRFWLSESRRRVQSCLHSLLFIVYLQATIIANPYLTLSCGPQNCAFLNFCHCHTKRMVGGQGTINPSFGIAL